VKGSERRAMLATIEQEVRATSHLTGRTELQPAVSRAILQVPREEFVPEGYREEAFGNFPLPIGSGQTISQPFMVAIMTSLLEPQADHRLLEVGTGSGYQAAILAELVRQVYSLEVVGSLAGEARERLARLGYDNVAVREGNGYLGWPEHAPYDGVIVTAAAPFVPQPLFDQLKPGGRLVIPVGMPFGHQELLLIHKQADGSRKTASLFAVAFVPLVE